MKTRSARRIADKMLPIIGIVVVLGAVLFLWQNLFVQLAVVIFGIFLIEAGIWQLAHPLLPSQRRYGALRNEVDDFIELVRRLNSAAVEREAGSAKAAAEAESVRAEMLESVERMAAFAGQETARDSVAAG